MTKRSKAVRFVAKYDMSRKKTCGVAVLLGVLMGVMNYFLDVPFTLGWPLVLQLAVALVVVIVLHEGIHGLVASKLGHKPIYGVKPPLVYVTFDHDIPREQFMAIALAPLIVLDAAFVLLYLTGFLKLFSVLCFSINTLGAVGDLWIFFALLPHSRGTLVQDTKTGIELWRAAKRKGPAAADEDAADEDAADVNAAEGPAGTAQENEPVPAMSGDKTDS